VSEEIPDELLHHVVASTALPAPVARRVIADVLGYFDETVEEYVRRRHTELKRHRVSNERIWARLAEELATRPVAAPALTERQLRRIVYG